MALGPFNLSAYRSLTSRSGSASLEVPPEARPDSPVVWFHASSDARLAILIDLADRLTGLRSDIPVLVTFDRRHLTGPHVPKFDGMKAILPLDPEQSVNAADFLSFWRPAVGFWAGGHLMPGLLTAAKGADIPMVLVDWTEADFVRERGQWVPDPQRTALQTFYRVFTSEQAASTRLQKQNVAADRIEIAPRLRESLSPPQCSEEDLTETSETLAGRPAWYASGLCAAELNILLSAHRQAVRFSHRLLLVISLNDPKDSVALPPLLASAGLRWDRWAPGDPIDEFLQVLVLDDPDAMPLWYRLAPVCLLGGTLVPDARAGPHPFLPAALGAAVLHGPHLGIYSDAYARLEAAGGSQLVTNASHLGDVVLQLSKPDQAALMAVAGWDVVTQGAWLTDRLLDLAQDLYDENEAAHARP